MANINKFIIFSTIFEGKIKHKIKHACNLHYLTFAKFSDYEMKFKKMKTKPSIVPRASPHSEQNLAFAGKSSLQLKQRLPGISNIDVKFI